MAQTAKQKRRKTAPVRGFTQHRAIVPRDGIAGRALTVVIAIMSFLACLTLGAVLMITEAARDWTSDVAAEVTIQVNPVEGNDINQAIREASRIALDFAGISRVVAINDRDAAALLEPWLGSGFDIAELPIPRLLTVSIAAGADPDLVALEKRLHDEVPGASLDDHQAWVDRLTSVAMALVSLGIAILALVLCATIVTVVFATQGAMVGNRQIVEVLHFVGAHNRFIAAEFQRHFLFLGLRGAAIGGVAAGFLFLMFLFAGWQRGDDPGDPFHALFGSYSLGITGYVAIALVTAAVAALTAFTSRLTVLRHLDRLDRLIRR